MMQAVEQSLRRLQTDRIGLYYCHRWDDTTPIEETLRALDDLIRLGKICYIGASAYASWQLAHANLLAEVKGWSRFVVLQSEYNLLKREVESEILPYCRTKSASCRTIRWPVDFLRGSTRWEKHRRLAHAVSR
jgi:aryl-alcohol dehydrogenase-like predicted oxidoreductase